MAAACTRWDPRGGAGKHVLLRCTLTVQLGRRHRAAQAQMVGCCGGWRTQQTPAAQAGPLHDRRRQCARRCSRRRSNARRARRFDVGGAVAQYASADQSPRKAARTADPLAAVVAAGARAVGRTLTEELHLGRAPARVPACSPGALNTCSVYEWGAGAWRPLLRACRARAQERRDGLEVRGALRRLFGTVEVHQRVATHASLARSAGGQAGAEGARAGRPPRALARRCSFHREQLCAPSYSGLHPGSPGPVYAPHPDGARGSARLLGREGAAHNPAAPHALASGTGAGAAMAVAAGLADFALGVDHLAGLRVRPRMLAPRARASAVLPQQTASVPWRRFSSPAPARRWPAPTDAGGGCRCTRRRAACTASARLRPVRRPAASWAWRARWMRLRSPRATPRCCAAPPPRSACPAVRPPCSAAECALPA